MALLNICYVSETQQTNASANQKHQPVIISEAFYIYIYICIYIYIYIYIYMYIYIYIYNIYFYNNSFCTQLVFVFHFLGDFYIVHDHIDAFCFSLLQEDLVTFYELF